MMRKRFTRTRLNRRQKRFSGCCATLPYHPPFEVASVKASDPNPQNSLPVGMAADPSVVRFDGERPF
jgi:hypothetical protein